MEVVTVYEVTFDSLENHDPIRMVKLGVFVEKDGLSAHGNAAKFIAAMPARGLYLGYDGKVYPRIEIETDYVK